MTTISSRAALTQRCTILRDANAGTTNARGNEQTPNWQPHATNVPCISWTGSGLERVTDETSIVTAERMRLIVTLDTDVTADDRIGDITDRGTSIITAPLSIRAVLHRPDHLELVLVELT